MALWQIGLVIVAVVYIICFVRGWRDNKMSETPAWIRPALISIILVLSAVTGALATLACFASTLFVDSNHALLAVVPLVLGFLLFCLMCVILIIGGFVIFNTTEDINAIGLILCYPIRRHAT